MRRFIFASGSGTFPFLDTKKDICHMNSTISFFCTAQGTSARADKSSAALLASLLPSLPAQESGADLLEDFMSSLGLEVVGISKV